MDKRSIRRAVVCMVFENEFLSDPEFFALGSFADEIAADFLEDDFKTVENIARGVLEHRDELDGVIRQNLKDWSLSRLSKTDLAILRLSLYEIIYLNVPYKVSINEAVELSKLYSDKKSPSFVNGVLGGYVNNR